MRVAGSAGKGSRLSALRLIMGGNRRGRGTYSVPPKKSARITNCWACELKHISTRKIMFSISIKLVLTWGGVR
jgi:hypothetical protein